MSRRLVSFTFSWANVLFLTFVLLVEKPDFEAVMLRFSDLRIVTENVPVPLVLGCKVPDTEPVTFKLQLERILQSSSLTVRNVRVSIMGCILIFSALSKLATT